MNLRESYGYVAPRTEYRDPDIRDRARSLIINTPCPFLTEAQSWETNNSYWLVQKVDSLCLKLKRHPKSKGGVSVVYKTTILHNFAQKNTQSRFPLNFTFHSSIVSRKRF